MTIYLKRVSSNIGENTPCWKNGKFWHIMEYKSNEAEMCCGTKSNVEIFEILIFWYFSGVKIQKLVKMTNLDQILDFDWWKVAESQNVKNCSIAFSYHPKSISRHNFSTGKLVDFLITLFYVKIDRFFNKEWFHLCLMIAFSC